MCGFPTVAQSDREQIREAPAPLYRCPIHDGAADPTIIYNREDESWWMFYTSRRANVDAADVAYVYGCEIGLASSHDNGRTWVHRAMLDLEFEPGHNTFWAPDVVYDEQTGLYHLFVSYIVGVRSHWGGDTRIERWTSTDLFHWEHQGTVELGDTGMIDGTIIRLENGVWRMWYRGKSIRTQQAESPDLVHWEVIEEPVVGDRAHEGPNVFRFDDTYWMVVDQWAGMGVYRSDDATNWRRVGDILTGPSGRPDDGPSGAHGDVVVVGEKAYIFYFTHPERKTHLDAPPDEHGNTPYGLRRSSIQAAELRREGEGLIAVREGFDFFLPSRPEWDAASEHNK